MVKKIKINVKLLFKMQMIICQFKDKGLKRKLEEDVIKLYLYAIPMIKYLTLFKKILC